MPVGDEIDSEAGLLVTSIRTRLANMIWRCVLFLIAVVTMTTIATWFAKFHWLADLCANLRVQQMIGLLVLLTIAAIYRRHRTMIICSVLVGIHALVFVSVYKKNQSEPGQVAELIVMTVNVWTPNSQFDQIVQQIQASDADVFAVLELGTPLHQHLEQVLAASYPYRFAFPQDSGNFGIGLYSRIPMTAKESFTLNVDSIVTLAASVRKDGQAYRLITTHPLPPMGASGFRKRNEHLAELAEKTRLEKKQHADHAMIVMGDLNLTPWSPWFSRFEVESQTRRASGGFGLTPTWYAKPAFPFGLALDHVFTSDDLRCVSHVVGGPIGSDHRAVTVGMSPK